MGRPRRRRGARRPGPRGGPTTTSPRRAASPWPGSRRGSTTPSTTWPTASTAVGWSSSATCRRSRRRSAGRSASGPEVAWRTFVAPGSITRLGLGPTGPVLRAFNETGPPAPPPFDHREWSGQAGGVAGSVVAARLGASMGLVIILAGRCRAGRRIGRRRAPRHRRRHARVPSRPRRSPPTSSWSAAAEPARMTAGLRVTNASLRRQRLLHRPGVRPPWRRRSSRWSRWSSRTSRPGRAREAGGQHRRPHRARFDCRVVDVDRLAA